MINDRDFKDFHYNVLGHKSKVIGDLILSGDAIITSQVEGNIEVRDEGMLILERGSFIKGKIKAINLEIFGNVEGEIECSGVVSIRSSAQVSGTIKAGKLVVYPGALLETETSTMEEAP